MGNLSVYLKHSITYYLFLKLIKQLEDFIKTVGNITIKGFQTLSYILKLNINWREVSEQSYRYAVTSLPITLSIVGMTSIIVAMQVASEMVKQGGGSYVGALVSVLTVRETGIIMSSFAIISMIGSSFASEIATMRVTEQIDAMKVLKVNPVQYLFVPRVLAGTLSMPAVWIVASLVGILGGGVAANLSSELTYRAYFESVRLGLFVYDIKVNLLKAIAYGFAISLISCTCGYKASGGAKGVGIATTKAVVWSFVTVVLFDLIFAMAFFF